MRPNRLAAAGVLLATGVGLLATAAVAAGTHPASRVKDGGTLRLNVSSTDVQSIDPAIDYEFIGWQLEYATCLKLMNYPDRAGHAGNVLQPEAAAGYPVVSEDGRTFTFRIRSGLRFNTGEPVTAATFAGVFNRNLNPKLQSPAVSFMGDVKGAQAVMRGKAKTASGVVAKGNRLSVTLVAAAPDFLARAAMPFFCAVPLNTPVPLTGNSLASAGPYYIASRTPNRQILLQRNPNYHGPRPHHVDTMTVTVNTNSNQSLLQIRANEADYDMYGLPSPASSQLAKQYGINKSRFFVHDSNAINYIAINTRRVSDLSMRRAINYAIDRPAMVRQAGVLAGEPTDQFLPPTLRGYRNADIYPLNAPNLAKAKALMNGRTTKMVLYSPNDPFAQSQDQVIVANLKAIGIAVTPKPLSFSALLAAIGDPKEPYDLALLGWLADYPDPVDFLNAKLSGTQITPTNNPNVSLVNDPALNRQLARAALLSGPRRYSTYGSLDIDIMRTVAPWVPLFVPTVREFVSSHVGCYLFQEAQAAMDLAHVCLK
ncbi:MAG TPA: ABC transporter substrate-binding protein [Gaiellaceae bacterium]|nr:ABC transporter substrate-binding protein [Gaiellaceae bacterium]